MAKAETGTLVLSFEIYRGDEHLRSEEISQESVTIGKGPAAMLRIEDDGRLNSTLLSTLMMMAPYKCWTWAVQVEHPSTMNRFKTPI